MNKQQIKGSAREMAGKIQKDVGKATANGSQVVKGAAREMAGKAEKAYGDAKSDIKGGAKEEAKRDRDIERHSH